MSPQQRRERELEGRVKDGFPRHQIKAAAPPSSLKTGAEPWSGKEQEAPQEMRARPRRGFIPPAPAHLSLIRSQCSWHSTAGNSAVRVQAESLIRDASCSAPSLNPDWMSTCCLLGATEGLCRMNVYKDGRSEAPSGGPRISNGSEWERDYDRPGRLKA